MKIDKNALNYLKLVQEKPQTCKGDQGKFFKVTTNKWIK